MENFTIEELLLKKNLKPYHFNPKQLEVLSKCLKANIPIEKILICVDYRFTYKQMEQIYLGLLSEIDISIYSSRKYNSYQMKQIRLGLEKNLDVMIYLNPKFEDIQMEQIRYGLIFNVNRIKKDKNLKLINVNSYAKVEFNYLQMKEIRENLEKNI